MSIKNFIKGLGGTAKIISFLKGVDQLNCINRQNQMLLRLKYQELFEKNNQTLSFSEVEFRSFSQNGEDGILHYIFSLIGTKSKLAIEICGGNFIECNSANLIINDGWHALMFDGADYNVKMGTIFYKSNKNTFSNPPKLVQSWITKNNINNLIQQSGYSGEIDFLSIDLDGVDYHVLNEISVVSPRVICIEINNAIPFDKSLTVPYDDKFDRFDVNPDFCSASLLAYKNLLERKDYRLIGTQSLGFNAFFMRNDTGQEMFKEIPVKEALSNINSQNKIANLWPLIRNLKWLSV